VHRPLGQQFEDSGAYVTAPAATTGATAPAVLSPATAAAAWAERSRSETGAETESRAETETGVTTALFAHLTAGGAALFVQGAAIVWVAVEGLPRSAELRSGEGAARERATGWSEGEIHVCVLSFDRKPSGLRCVNDISRRIAM